MTKNTKLNSNKKENNFKKILQFSIQTNETETTENTFKKVQKMND